jgi:predicted GIY-YIG superfamily endonuclease
MAFYVYILASGRNGTLYIGMTDDLVKRSGNTAMTSSPALRSAMA